MIKIFEVPKDQEERYAAMYLCSHTESGLHIAYTDIENTFIDRKEVLAAVYGFGPNSINKLPIDVDVPLCAECGAEKVSATFVGVTSVQLNSNLSE